MDRAGPSEGLRRLPPPRARGPDLRWALLLGGATEETGCHVHASSRGGQGTRSESVHREALVRRQPHLLPRSVERDPGGRGQGGAMPGAGGYGLYAPWKRSRDTSPKSPRALLVPRDRRGSLGLRPLVPSGGWSREPLSRRNRCLSGPRRLGGLHPRRACRAPCLAPMLGPHGPSAHPQIGPARSRATSQRPSLRHCSHLAPAWTSTSPTLNRGDGACRHVPHRSRSRPANPTPPPPAPTHEPSAFARATVHRAPHS